jgi:hypothetical protein
MVGWVYRSIRTVDLELTAWVGSLGSPLILLPTQAEDARQMGSLGTATPDLKKAVGKSPV